jgi:hypothetical protein
MPVAASPVGNLAKRDKAGVFAKTFSAQLSREAFDSFGCSINASTIT